LEGLRQVAANPPPTQKIYRRNTEEYRSYDTYFSNTEEMPKRLLKHRRNTEGTLKQPRVTPKPEEPN
jgi:hypothetical protein